MIAKCKILMKDPRIGVIKEFEKIFHIHNPESKFEIVEAKILADPDQYMNGIIVGITFEEMNLTI